MIGRDDLQIPSLEPAPEVIDRVEFGMLTRPPEQADAQLFGQTQAAGTTVAAVAVQQEPERAAGSHAVAQATQKGVVIRQPLLLSNQQHAPTGKPGQQWRLVPVSDSPLDGTPPAAPTRLTALLQPGTVTLRGRHQGIGEVVLEVVDTGTGIPGPEIERVFERFYRRSESRKQEGFGLGLAIARRMVDVMGGEIGAESVLGEGSTFWVRLPLAQPSPTPVA